MLHVMMEVTVIHKAYKKDGGPMRGVITLKYMVPKLRRRAGPPSKQSLRLSDMHRLRRRAQPEVSNQYASEQLTPHRGGGLSLA